MSRLQAIASHIDLENNSILFFKSNRMAGKCFQVLLGSGKSIQLQIHRNRGHNSTYNKCYSSIDFNNELKLNKLTC